MQSEYHASKIENYTKTHSALRGEISCKLTPEDIETKTIDDDDDDDGQTVRMFKDVLYTKDLLQRNNKKY